MNSQHIQQVELCETITIDNKKRITASPFTVYQNGPCASKQEGFMEKEYFDFIMPG